MSGSPSTGILVSLGVVVLGVGLQVAPATLAFFQRLQLEHRCGQVERPIELADPGRAAHLAHALLLEPAEGDCVLARWGMDRAGFLGVIEAIANDPASAEAYAGELGRLESAPSAP